MQVLKTIKRFQGWLLAGSFALALAACGGGGSGGSTTTTTTTTTTSSTTSSGVTSILSSGSNVVTMTVEAGPNPDYRNTPYVTVKVCAPNNASLCDTVPNVLVDTGSVGLRVLASALPNTLSSLTQVTDAASGNPLNECGLFASGYTWGTVRQGGVTLGSETTSSSQNIQVIGDSSAGPVPTYCESAGSNYSEQTASTLTANGIIGLNGIHYDCGSGCVSASTPNPGTYYECPSTTTACSAVNVPLSNQVANIVYSLPTDNNGVIVQLPAVGTDGAATATGALIFGIGTQSNNTLGSASEIPTDAYGDFTATLNGSSVSGSFVDTGSTYYFFTASQLGLTQCTINTTSFFCPASTVTESSVFSASNGSSSNTYNASFPIANAYNVLSASSNYAIGNVAAVNSYSSITGLDFGLPFVYSRNVYIGNQTSIGNGGYVAFSSN